MQIDDANLITGDRVFFEIDSNNSYGIKVISKEEVIEKNKDKVNGIYEIIKIGEIRYGKLKKK